MSDIKMISLPIEEYQRLDRIVDAADALAKAVDAAHKNISFAAKQVPHWASVQSAEKILRKALAAYQKARGIGDVK